MTPTHEGEVCEAEEPVCEPESEPEPQVGTSRLAPASVDRIVAGVAGPPVKERSILEHYSPLRWMWPGELGIDADVGGHRERVVEVWNDDGVPRSLFSVYITGSSAFTVVKAPSVIPPRSSAKITVAFTPHSDAVDRATLLVAPERGVGVAKPLVGHATRPETVTAPSPTTVERPAPSRETPVIDNSKNTWRLAGPSTIDLGDNLVGARTSHTTSVFALDREQGPRIRARVVGDGSITLKQSPLFLPGTRSPYHASNELALEHAPTKRATSSAMLEIEILDAPHETFRYPDRKSVV